MHDCSSRGERGKMADRDTSRHGQDESGLMRSTDQDASDNGQIVLDVQGPCEVCRRNQEQNVQVAALVYVCVTIVCMYVSTLYTHDRVCMYTRSCNHTDRRARMHAITNIHIRTITFAHIGHV